MRSNLFPVLLLVLLINATAADPVPAPPPPPDAAQIAQALERGKMLRDLKGLVPNALISSAVTLKVGETRNGFAMVKLEDGRADGAVYKLTERLKVAMPEGKDMVVS